MRERYIEIVDKTRPYVYVAGFILPIFLFSRGGGLGLALSEAVVRTQQPLEGWDISFLFNFATIFSAAIIFAWYTSLRHMLAAYHLLKVCPEMYRTRVPLNLIDFILPALIAVFVFLTATLLLPGVVEQLWLLETQPHETATGTAPVD